MTYEEALKWFKDDMSDGMCSPNCPQCNANMLAIEALERAVPKKPFVEPYFYGKYYRCPTCGRMVEKNKCCSNNDCRQCLDWNK